MPEASHGVKEVGRMIAVVLRIRIRGQEVLNVRVREVMVADIFDSMDSMDTVQKQPEDPNVSGQVHTSGLRHDT